MNRRNFLKSTAAIPIVGIANKESDLSLIQRDIIAEIEKKGQPVKGRYISRCCQEKYTERNPTADCWDFADEYTPQYDELIDRGIIEWVPYRGAALVPNDFEPSLTYQQTVEMREVEDWDRT